MSELYKTPGAAKRLNVSESYLNQLRVRGGGPKFLRLGRSIRYRDEDLAAWAEAGAASSTSEYTPHAA